MIVAIILVFFSVMVFYFSYSNQMSKFRDNLVDRARSTAILFVNVSEVDSLLVSRIQQTTISLKDAEIALTDSAFNILYSSNINYLSDEVIKVHSDAEVLKYFSILDKDGVYYKHRFKNHSYNVLVLAIDQSRIENLSTLRRNLFWSILISISLSLFLAYFFSRKAIEPISKIISGVKEINSLKLNTRLDEGNRKDEIAQLAMTFNKMITDLEISFRNQEDFVSNASHELRTPLAVMIAESDYILNQEITNGDYQKHIKSMVSDLRNLNLLLNNLLELAQVNRDKNIEFSNIRIDESIFDAIQQVKTKYKDRKIMPRIQYPETGNDLLVFGNEGLLIIAFKNLIDNACKFSYGEVDVEFIISAVNIIINISDSGIGIPDSEMDSIYKPFKRANNVKFISGFGVGLTLVSKIMELHRSVLLVHSKEGEGTRFECIFKRVSG
jgi:signal transduction histidine kinase